MSDSEADSEGSADSLHSLNKKLSDCTVAVRPEPPAEGLRLQVTLTTLDAVCMLLSPFLQSSHATVPIPAEIHKDLLQWAAHQDEDFESLYSTALQQLKEAFERYRRSPALRLPLAKSVDVGGSFEKLLVRCGVLAAKDLAGRYTAPSQTPASRLRMELFYRKFTLPSFDETTSIAADLIYPELVKHKVFDPTDRDTKWAIYRWENVCTGMSYIGQVGGTTTVWERTYQHFYDAFSGGSNRELEFAIRTHRFSDWRITVVDTLKNHSADLELLQSDGSEKFHLRFLSHMERIETLKHNCLWPYGYNLVVLTK